MKTLCPQCHAPMTAEAIGRTARLNGGTHPGIIVSYCGECRLVVMPAYERTTADDYPRSTSDRRNGDAA